MVTKPVYSTRTRRRLLCFCSCVCGLLSQNALIQNATAQNATAQNATAQNATAQNASAQNASAPENAPVNAAKVSRSITGVKLISARTHSEKSCDKTMEFGDRVRVLRVAMKFPTRFDDFALYTLERDDDDGVYSLQDSRGRHYLPFGKGSGSYGKEKDGVFRFNWICPNIVVPEAERKSLRFKARVFMRDTTSKTGKLISYWIDVPVTYAP